MLIALVTAAHACSYYVYDDYSDGSTDGRQSGGTFVSGGWRPDGGTIVYDLPTLVSGTITFRLTNVDEVGVSQHDLLELFSGPDGSFSDGNRDNFLQVKFAGDIYDGYDGRVKLQVGPEMYGDAECGAWTSEYDWNPDGSYDFSVSWDATSASMDIGGVLSASVDATPCDDIGPLTFSSMVLPNNGSYARDALMDDVVIGGVSLCGVEASTETDTDTDSDADTDTDTDTDADTDTDTDTDTDADTDAASAPSVPLFTIEPPTAEVGAKWVVAWSAEGDASSARLCFTRDGSALETCTDLPGPSGQSVVATDDFAPGAYQAQVVAAGPGGEGASATVALSLDAASATESKGCSSTGRSRAGALGLAGLLVATAGLRRPRRLVERRR